MFDKIQIIGHLGRDPEMRQITSGDNVTSFSVAVNRYKNKEERTIWFKISTFDKLAENCNKYLKKGSPVFCEGTIDFDVNTGGPRIYDKKDGSKGSSFEITASKVVFLPSSRDPVNPDPVISDSSIPPF